VRRPRSPPWQSSSGATAAQVSLAWLLDRSPVVLPIPGTATIDHLEEKRPRRASG
jgi:aryl-alcohol dehydrogenase-like predicted oxidoreductase